MAMKQTQTKLFDFSDVGLDFCAGSKNLFPDRFKKMLALGYNEQTVSSVAVAGNQVTLTYGGTHSYVADRVLKVNAPELLSINGGEFVIDSVTENTVTMTIDGAPTSIAGNFTTKVAPLGWELMYESADSYIAIYKMKHIDDSYRYVRFCYQSNATHRNSIAVCIGKTYDIETGIINDPLALQATASVTSPSAGGMPRWDGYNASSSDNNKTYNEGYSTYGKAIIFGSLYHLILPLCWGTSHPIDIYGIIPVCVHKYDALDYPLLICKSLTTVTSSYGENTYGNFYSTSGRGVAYIGNVPVVFSDNTHDNAGSLAGGRAAARSSVLPSALDSFDTTTAQPIAIYELSSYQHLGFCYGAYKCQYSSDTKAPTISKTNLPIETVDTDFTSKVFIACSGSSNDKTRAFYMAIPIEEVKIA